MISHRLAILTIFPLSLFLSACASTGPVDDGFENSHESIDIGRIHTGELLELVLKTTKGSASSDEKNTSQ